MFTLSAPLRHATIHQCLRTTLAQYSPEVLAHIAAGNLDVQELLRALECAEELSEDMTPEEAAVTLRQLIVVAYTKGFQAHWLAAHPAPCATAG